MVSVSRSEVENLFLKKARRTSSPQRRSGRKKLSIFPGAVFLRHELTLVTPRARPHKQTTHTQVPEPESCPHKTKKNKKSSKMPRCLMAKKFKAYPWPDRVEEPQAPSSGRSPTPPSPPPPPQVIVEVLEEDEEIDVVGDNGGATSASPSSAGTGSGTTASTCWGPSSPTAGATAPSPPPHSPEAATRDASSSSSASSPSASSTILYNGKSPVFV